MPITKRHKSALMSGIVVALGASLLAGCAADPIAVPKSETYTRDFIKTFGTFDQSHDWNHATQATVNVTTAKATDIKIYALVDNVRYLFGTYLGVEGQRTLSVDIPKGTTDLIVRANGIDHNVKPGGSLSLTGERNRTFGTPIDGQPVTFTPTETAKEFPVEIIKEYINALPEDKVNIDAVIPSTGQKVITNFYFVSDGSPVTLYPLFWHTDSHHALGVYWLNEDGKLDTDCMVDIYYTKSGELKVWKNGDVKGDENGNVTLREDKWHYGDNCSNCQQYGTDNIETISEDNPFLSQYYNSGTKLIVDNEKVTSVVEGGNTQFHKIEAIKEGVATPRAPESVQISYNIDETQSAVTKGVTLTFDAGVKYGFYLKVKNSAINLDPSQQQIDHLVFSQEIRNRQFGTSLGANPKPGQFTIGNQAEIYGKKWSSSIPGFDEDNDYVQAAYAVVPVTIGDETKEYAIFSFDDWKQTDQKNPDLNDLVFIFDENHRPSKIVDEDVIVPDVAYTWIIACEDLGTNDFDFNDVVFGVGNLVEKTVGDVTTKTVDITPLAAGGTLPVYLYYDGNRIIPDGTSEGEFHSWFGKFPSNRPLNAHTFSPSDLVHNLTVKDNFTMECCKLVEGGESGNMGGFQVYVEYPTGTQIITANNPNAANPDLGKEIGEAPQMICVPYTWLWPRENVIITSVYDKFTEWCADKTQHNEWHKDPKGTPSSHYVYREIKTSTTKPENPNPGPGTDPVEPDKPKPIELSSEYYDNGWGAGARYKYYIDSKYLVDAISVKINIDYSGANQIEIMKLSDSQYGTANWSKEFTGDELTTLKEDKAFYILYKEVPDLAALSSTVTIEVTYLKSE